MQRSTLKTILLVIGSGIAGILLFIAAVIGYISYKLSGAEPGKSMEFPVSRSERKVSVPPPVTEMERFFGSHGIYSGDFASERSQVLDKGPGKLIGLVTSGGKPVSGLRLRLALNGRVLSQWTTTDSTGKYEIAVPYAQYRIDGYSLDSSVANTVLKGKTDNPRNAHRSEIMTVADGRPGKALDLDFVDPVRKKGPTGDVSLSKPVVISWDPYAGAASYRVQLVEQKDPRSFEDQKRLFDWRNRPTVTATSLNLSDTAISLTKGFHYTVEIDAMDAENRPLSRSVQNHGRPDFLTTD